MCSELARSAFALLNVAEVDGRWHYTFSGAGEVFSVVWPEMSREMEMLVIRVGHTRGTRYVLPSSE